MVPAGLDNTGFGPTAAYKDSFDSLHMENNCDDVGEVNLV